MPKTLMGVVYDVRTLALRSVIDPHDDNHLDGRHVGKNQVMIRVPANLGAGMSITEFGLMAIRQHTGMEPPSMAEVHKADELERVKTGAG